MGGIGIFRITDAWWTWVWPVLGWVVLLLIGALAGAVLMATVFRGRVSHAEVVAYRIASHSGWYGVSAIV